MAATSICSIRRTTSRLESCCSSYLTRNADNLNQAIAGYYQGLGGVRKNGMNTDTKQYVKSVRALMKKFD